MTCGGCGKREASVSFKKIENGRIVQQHLCPECAASADAGPGGAAPIFNLLSMLAGAPARRAPKPPAACPECGQTFGGFKKEGRLGCPSCYVHFRKPLGEVLASYHGFRRHRGKVPLCSPEAREALRAGMEDAVAREDFEAAARLRDRLDRLPKEPGCS